MEQKLNEVEEEKLSAETNVECFNLNVSAEFFPGSLVNIGRKITNELYMQLLAFPNESSYAHIVMNILIPTLLFQYFSRCGHLRERNSTFRSLLPYVHSSGKLKYQEALL